MSMFAWAVAAFAVALSALALVAFAVLVHAWLSWAWDRDVRRWRSQDERVGSATVTDVDRAALADLYEGSK